MQNQEQIKTQRAQLSNLGNCKWPRMFVWGESVTEQQAKNIILRTDSYFTSLEVFTVMAPRRAWDQWACETLGFTPYLNQEKPNWPFLGRLMQGYRDELELVETEYVHNRWADTGFVGGPYGWVHPSGKIWFSNNIGSHPCFGTVFDDWQALAKAFPYLSLHVTLMSDEEGCEDSEPLATLFVAHGAVTVLPEPIMPPKELDPGPLDISAAMKEVHTPGRRQGLPQSWIEEFGQATKAALKKVSERIENAQAENEVDQT